MADQIARTKQYEYKANSNLVLQSTERRDRSHEATGEPGNIFFKKKNRFLKFFYNKNNFPFLK